MRTQIVAGGASPVLGLLNLLNFGGKGDLRTLTDAAMSLGSTSLTSASAGFTSADRGKVVIIDGAGAGGTVLRTTVVGIVSPTEATLALAGRTAVSGKTACVGTDNAQPLRDALAKLQNQGGGGLYIPPGDYGVNSRVDWPTTLNNASVFGVNPGNTGFVSLFNGEASIDAMLFIQPSGSNTLSGIQLSGLTFRGAGDSDSLGAYDLVTFSNRVSDLLIEDCSFYWGKRSAVRVTASVFGSRHVWQRCHFHDCATRNMGTVYQGAALLGCCAPETKVLDSWFENLGQIGGGQPQNSWHAVYVSGTCDFIMQGCHLIGLCSRLHMFGADPTGVTGRTASIVGNWFDGQHGGGLANVVWNQPNAVLSANAFRNTGLSIGCDGVQVQGGSCTIDSAVPANPFYFVQTGRQARGCVVRGVEVISLVAKATSVPTAVYVANSGSDRWTVDDLTWDADPSTPCDLALARFDFGAGHVVSRNRGRSHLNDRLIWFKNTAGGGSLVRDNETLSLDTGTTYPVWDETQDPTNVYVGNRWTANANGTAYVGVIAENASALESGSDLHRQGQRRAKHLSYAEHWTPGAIVAGAVVTRDLTVPGAVVGSQVAADFSAVAGGCTVSASVTAPGVVSVWIANPTSGLITLAAGSVKVRVTRILPDWSDGAAELAYTGSWTPGTLSNLATVTTTVTVTGAALGDAVAPKLSNLGGNLAILFAYVSAVDTVTVWLQNVSGGSITIAAGTLTLRVRPI